MSQYRRLLSYDPDTKTKKWFIGDDDEGTFHIEYEQDVADIIEANKEKQLNGYDMGIYESGGEAMFRCASIPNIFVVKWLNDYGINVYDDNHWPEVRKKLNDRDWQWLKTTEKTI